jgi:hypothetical protein
MPEVAPSPGAFIIVFAAPQTALVHIAVFGVLDMPFVPDIELAEQGLDHVSLRLRTQIERLVVVAGVGMFRVVPISEPPRPPGTVGIFLPAVAALAAILAVVHSGQPVMADSPSAKQFPDHGDVFSGGLPSCDLACPTTWP